MEENLEVFGETAVRPWSRFEVELVKIVCIYTQDQYIVRLSMKNEKKIDRLYVPPYYRTLELHHQLLYYTLF